LNFANLTIKGEDTIAFTTTHASQLVDSEHDITRRNRASAGVGHFDGG
jgi:hypothetical protein